MKNAFTALVLFLIIYEVKTQIVCEQVTQASEDDDCRIHPTQQNSTHCCYVPDDAETPCWELTDDEYENIKKFKSFAKQYYGDMPDLSIKCSNQALTISLLSLILLIVFII